MLILLGAGALGSNGTWMDFALLPCIFLLTVFASFITSAEASVAESAWMRRVAKGRIGLNNIALALVKLLKDTVRLVQLMMSVCAAVWSVIKFGSLSNGFEGLYLAPKLVANEIISSKFATFFACPVSKIAGIVVSF